MKKLLYLFIAFSAMCFVACGNKTTTTDTTADTVDTLIVDTVSFDSI